MFSSVCVGNLTRDPEVKYSQDGKSIVKFSLACRRTGEITDFFDFTAFNKVGETISKYATKGDKIVLNCSVRQDKWKDGDGNNRSKVVFIVEDFEFCGGKKKESENAQPKETTLEDVLNGNSPETNDAMSGLPF